jgi:S-ribosylhomocysteine lyase LuxS involved in autoinducer biosynthesis
MAVLLICPMGQKTGFYGMTEGEIKRKYHFNIAALPFWDDFGTNG